MYVMKLFDLIKNTLRRRVHVSKSDGLNVSRRAFTRGAATGLLLPGAAIATPEPKPVGLAALSRAELSAMLRGLTDLDDKADATLSAHGQALLAQITEIMPEAPKVLELHQLYPDSIWGDADRPEVRIDMTALHDACYNAQPVSFDYQDLRGNHTTRRVLPIELVHPDHGILLLAWCELRGAHRKFFVHAMDNLRIHDGDFKDRRMGLLDGAIAEQRARKGDYA